MSAGAVAGALSLHPAIPVAAYGLALAAVVIASLARPGRPTPPGPAAGSAAGRAGLVVLALATVVAVADRHLLVAGPAFAPDDALAVLTLVAAAIATRAPRWRGAAYALAVATYAVVGVILIAGKPYHTDAVVATHGGAELLLAGRHPYADFDMLERLERFGLPRALATDLEDGSPLRSLNYPVLAVLLPAPFLAAGLQDVRVLYLVVVLAILTLVAGSAREPWRAFALAAGIGNVAIARQFVLAGVDPSWALLVLAAWLARERRWSAFPLGLAIAARQPAWLIAPFVVAWTWRRAGPREALTRGAIAIAIATLVHVPFLLTAPGAVVGGVTDVVLLPLERHGIGPSTLDAFLALPRAIHLAVAAVALATAWWIYATGRVRSARAALTLPFVPLYLGWRALQSYFAPLPLLLLVEEGRAGVPPGGSGVPPGGLEDG